MTIQAPGQPVIHFSVVKSARRTKTLQVRVDPAQGVVVSAPVWATDEELREFVNRRADWILARTAEIDARTAPRLFLPGDTLPYRGREVRICVKPSRGKRVRVCLSGSMLELSMPGELEGQRRLDGIQSALTAWYRRSAAELVTRAVERWAPLVGAAPSRVFVRDQKRRWGSCAADGSLRFNWRLAMAGDDLMDYVVVHELAHLMHKGHSRGFWSEVERVMPAYRVNRKRLAETGHRLHL